MLRIINRYPKSFSIFDGSHTAYIGHLDIFESLCSKFYITFRFVFLVDTGALINCYNLRSLARAIFCNNLQPTCDLLQKRAFTCDHL